MTVAGRIHDDPNARRVRLLVVLAFAPLVIFTVFLLAPSSSNLLVDQNRDTGQLLAAAAA